MRRALPYSSHAAACALAMMGKPRIGVLDEGLRQEVQHLPGVHVCTLLPGPVDTPAYQHAANYSGREVKALPMLYTAQQVARVTVKLARRPRREAFAGPAFGLLTSFGKKIAPGLSEAITGTAARRLQRGHHLQPATTGAVNQPMHDGLATSGGWRRRYQPLAWAAAGAVLGALVVGRAAARR